MDTITEKNLNAAWLRENFVNDVHRKDLRRAQDQDSPVYEFMFCLAILFSVFWCLNLSGAATCLIPSPWCGTGGGQSSSGGSSKGTKNKSKNKSRN